jgi:hypothetical protein
LEAVMMTEREHDILVVLERVTKLAKELMRPDDPHVCHKWTIEQAEKMAARIKGE